MERERPTDEAYDEADAALSQGELERVEELLGPWVADDVRDPEACALVGLARYYADDHEHARPLLEWAVDHDCGGPETKAALGACEFMANEIDSAEEHLTEAVKEEPDWAEGHYWLACLREWQSRHDPALAHEAEKGFAIAAQLDPEGFPVPPRLSEDEFDSVLEEAIRELPPEFAIRLEEVNVVVEPYPDDALFGKGRGTPGPDLVGYYDDGVPRDGASAESVPGVIHLFQRNLELSCGTREELVEEIRVTLLHEVGHYLGMEEEDLEELDL